MQTHNGIYVFLYQNLNKVSWCDGYKLKSNLCISILEFKCWNNTGRGSRNNRFMYFYIRI